MEQGSDLLLLTFTWVGLILDRKKARCPPKEKNLHFHIVFPVYFSIEKWPVRHYTFMAEPLGSQIGNVYVIIQAKLSNLGILNKQRRCTLRMYVYFVFGFSPVKPKALNTWVAT